MVGSCTLVMAASFKWKRTARVVPTRRSTGSSHEVWVLTKLVNCCRSSPRSSRPSRFSRCPSTGAGSLRDRDHVALGQMMTHPALDTGPARPALDDSDQNARFGCAARCGVDRRKALNYRSSKEGPTIRPIGSRGRYSAFNRVAGGTTTVPNETEACITWATSRSGRSRIFPFPLNGGQFARTKSEALVPA
jgi:hypothetical protein